MVVVAFPAWIETPGRMGEGNGRGKERITPCGSVVITAPDRDGDEGGVRLPVAGVAGGDSGGRSVEGSCGVCIDDDNGDSGDGVVGNVKEEEGKRWKGRWSSQNRN